MFASKLLSIWLFMASGLTTLVLPNGAAGIPVCAVHCVQSVRAFSFDYERRIQAPINYDGSSKSTFDYDGVGVCAANECAKQSFSSRTLFAKSVEFLAAEGGGIRLSQKGLDLVESHVGQFGNDAANSGMLQRLNDAFAAGQKVTGADANFYLHEASEATMMGRGLGYDAAHAAAIEKYGVSPFSLYHPEVIQANPGLFNNAWRNYWNLPTKP